MGKKQDSKLNITNTLSGDGGIRSKEEDDSIKTEGEFDNTKNLSENFT